MSKTYTQLQLPSIGLQPAFLSSNGLQSRPLGSNPIAFASNNYSFASIQRLSTSKHRPLACNNLHAT